MLKVINVLKLTDGSFDPSATFKELVALKMDGHMVATLKSRIFFFILGQLGVQSVWVRDESGHEELVTMLPRRLSDGIDEMLKKFDLDRPEVREQPPRNIFLAQD